MAGELEIVGLGMATTGFASSGEQAQTVATPVFFVLIGTAVWAGMNLADGLDLMHQLTPGEPWCSWCGGRTPPRRPFPRR